jgi:hypothetical protein
MIAKLTQVACLLVLLVACFGKGAGQTPSSKIDIPKLIRAAQLNGEANSKKVFDYSWKSKTLIEEFKRSRLLKKVEQEHEVYPSRGITFVVQKLVAENGAALPPKRAAKEQKRVDAELIHAELAANLRAEGETTAAKRTGCPTFGIWTVLDGVSGKPASLGVSDFLCFGKFSSPRVERKDGRDTVVLLFRPRDNLNSLAKDKTPFSKLVGVMWIDLKDKIVSRIEAWTVEKPGPLTERELQANPPTLVFDDMRLADGTWVRRSLAINTRTDPKAFNNLNLECKQEFSSYVRYYTEFKDIKIQESTNESPSSAPPP